MGGLGSGQRRQRHRRVGVARSSAARARAVTAAVAAVADVPRGPTHDDRPGPGDQKGRSLIQGRPQPAGPSQLRPAGSPQVTNGG